MTENLMSSFRVSIPNEISREEWIVFILNKWISKIEYNQDKYSVVRIPCACDDVILSQLLVKYEENLFSMCIFFRKYKEKDNGRLSLCAMIKLTALNEGNEILDDNKAPTLFVNDYFDANYNNISVVLK